MKKLIKIFMVILCLQIGVINNAKASNIKADANVEQGLTVSVNLNEQQETEVLKAILANKEIAEPKEVKEKFFSAENLKKYTESDFIKNLTVKLFKIFLIILIAGFIKRIIKMTLKVTLTKVEHQKSINKKQKQRINTILPLINNTLNILFFILVLFMVLSELGLDIAPLLAGAGVVGLAIGFGAQALVKDFITGFFILLEGVISIGDVVKIGSISGVVESLSIKSVVLRDITGAVHTIPFGDVTTITNMTKDFSYHVFEIGVAYKENTDKVVKEIEKICAKMYKDKELSKSLLSDEVEIFGVNSLDDSAVVIKGRFKTRPGKQWAIGREFNRRVKLEFDKLGIEIPYPHTTVYFGQDVENIKIKK